MLLRPCASQNPANFTFKTGDQVFLVATAVTLSIAFLPQMLEHGPQGLQIGFSNGILFSALGSIQGYKVQHSLVTWGRLEIFFLFQP
jgi:hypothetical protein